MGHQTTNTESSNHNLNLSDTFVGHIFCKIVSGGLYERVGPTAETFVLCRLRNVFIFLRLLQEKSEKTIEMHDTMVL